MKKMLVIFVLFSMVSVLWATGQGEDQVVNEGPVNLVMAISGGDNDKAVVEQLLAEVQGSLEGINVELLLLADFDRTITTRLVGGQQVDIMVVAESVHQFSDRNQLESLNNLISNSNLDMDSRFGSSKDLYSRNGNVYALPLRGGPMVVYCNMDVLDEKPQIDWSFNDFNNAAINAFRKGDTTADTIWGFVPAGNGVWWPWYTSFVYAAGGSLFDENGQPNFDDPNTIEGLKNYVSFIQESKVGPSMADMADLGQTSPDPVFNSGKAAMIATGWWNVGSLQDADFNWDIAAMPNDNGKGTVIFGQGLAITSSSKHKGEAFRVIDALTDVLAQESIVDLKWDIPANINVLQSDVFLNAEWSRNKLDMSAVADAISKGAISLPYNPEWNQTHDIIGNVINETLYGSLSVEESAVRIQKELMGKALSN